MRSFGGDPTEITLKSSLQIPSSILSFQPFSFAVIRHLFHLFSSFTTCHPKRLLQSSSLLPLAHPYSLIAARPLSLIKRTLYRDKVSQSCSRLFKPVTSFGSWHC
ncbi:Uncharacterized protein TCM_027167 [Theobroma cacao]|uniref:Uncharacterized protein n=1 Tax=Theobroma cacao TaxID=3641 RepID=A0A061G7H7_THECC|nr:Uncharacterized protein TCM_027167 [Theobroma cacao]